MIVTFEVVFENVLNQGIAEISIKIIWLNISLWIFLRITKCFGTKALTLENKK